MGFTTTAPSAVVTVVSAIDGDSIEIEGPEGRVQVRLDGINAPESEECYHREATGHITALLEGREVGVEVTGTDQFGRVLAHIHLDHLDVNLEMVSAGMAIATTPDPGRPETLIEAEESAAGLERGLWDPQACGTGPIPRVVIDFARSVVDPPGPDDQTPDQELIVLINREDADVDLDGWALRDESSRHRYHFPRGSRLAPGDSLTVTSADPGWAPGGSPVWNNGGDLILVLDELGRVVARFRY